MELSVVLPAKNEVDNLRRLIPRLRAVLLHEGVSCEIIVVVDGESVSRSGRCLSELGARIVREKRRGYAGALETGFAEATGDYILTLDADMSHDPDVLSKMWRARTRGEIVIASRYVRGGVAYTNVVRRTASVVLNKVLRRILSVPVYDLSSGYRLYRREVLASIVLDGTNFEVLEELLVRAYAQGFSVVEVPFTYFPRAAGRSHARLARFGLDIARATFALWKVRNSLDSADYDERAFYSAIPVQRYWHRRRHHITVSWSRGVGRILDAGCGTSMIVQSLNNVIGLDVKFYKLRFLRRYTIPLVQASAFGLPFKDDSFDCVISSQVIEHIPFDHSLFEEMRRVLKSGGVLILGTPDYSTLGWRIIEPIYGFVMPGGYKDEHITHYNKQMLVKILESYGFSVEEAAYIARSELIVKCRLNKGEAVDADNASQALKPRAA